MQMTKDVHTVEGSAIGSLTAPSWRPCSRSKPEVLARRTTWPIPLQTGSATVYLSPNLVSLAKQKNLTCFYALVDVAVLFLLY